MQSILQLKQNENNLMKIFKNLDLKNNGPYPEFFETVAGFRHARKEGSELKLYPPRERTRNKPFDCLNSSASPRLERNNRGDLAAY